MIKRQAVSSQQIRRYFVKHGVDDILFRVKRVRGPSGPETKQDPLTHVDVCRGQVVDLVNDEVICRLTQSCNAALRRVSDDTIGYERRRKRTYETWTVGKELGEYRKPPTVLPHDGLNA
jgi:hypothetical protein